MGNLFTPNKTHDLLIKEFIDRIKELNNRYMGNEINLYKCKIWKSDCKEEFTRSEIVKGVTKISYIDYIITSGINEGIFYINNSPMSQGHTLLGLEIVEHHKLKLDRMKEVVEPLMLITIKQKKEKNILFKFYQKYCFQNKKIA